MIYRAQIAITAETNAVADRMVMTPHFRDLGALSDPHSLAGDLADAIVVWLGVARQVNVKLYDAEAAKPNYPKADEVRNFGGVAPGNGPREIALCLSFFSDRNVPRQRGRVYAPINLVNTSQLSVRPNLTQRQKVADLAPIFQDLGGPDVDWCVWSRTESEAHPVTNWWVDDEWDVVRSRGMTGTERLTGVTSEA